MNREKRKGLQEKIRETVIPLQMNTTNIEILTHLRKLTLRKGANKINIRRPSFHIKRE